MLFEGRRDRIFVAWMVTLGCIGGAVIAFGAGLLFSEGIIACLMGPGICVGGLLVQRCLGVSLLMSITEGSEVELPITTLSARVYTPGLSIGFKDQNGVDLCLGQRVRTYDSRGREWIGTIVAVDPRSVGGSPAVLSGGIPYAFKSNYETWINDQEHASELEILYSSKKVRNKVRYIRT